jgi:putative oxidoreductase
MSSQAISNPQTRSFTTTAVAATSSALLVPLARVFYALIFLFAGPGHFAKAPIAYAAAQGVPFASILVPFSGLLALAGGLSIALGYRARIGAWLLVLFLVPVTFMMHNFWAVTDPMMHQLQQAMFFKNLALIGGALLISQFGAGPYSLDARRG